MYIMENIAINYRHKSFGTINPVADSLSWNYYLYILKTLAIILPTYPLHATYDLD